MPKGASSVWAVDDRHEQRVSSIVLNLALELPTPVLLRPIRQEQRFQSILRLLGGIQNRIPFF